MQAILIIFKFLGALGIFLFGMKLMSEGLQKIAGKRIRNIIKNMTVSRYTGLLSGFLLTAFIQSSSATSVMVVGFVNAGLLSFTESLGLIMGANIGTTLTTWLVTIFGFQVSMKPFALIFIGLFFPLIFSQKTNRRNIGTFIFGFGILFIGLALMQDAVPDLNANEALMNFIKQFVNYGWFSTLLFVFIGMLLTFVVQSSSASTTVTLILISKGWIPLEFGAAMIIGENIGTTLTANLAATVANINAKRTARFHLLFNLIGAIWIMLLLPLVLRFISGSVDNTILFIADLFNKPDLLLSTETKSLFSLAMFHSIFNVLNVFLLIWFVNPLGELIKKMMPAKHDEDTDHSLRYISSGLVATPELAISTAKNELQEFAKLAEMMCQNAYMLLFDPTVKHSILIEKIKSREQTTDDLEEELLAFLSHTSQEDLSAAASREINAMIAIAHNLERVADLCYEMAKNFERLNLSMKKIPFDAQEELKAMYKLLFAQLKLTRQNLTATQSITDISASEELEKQINEKRSTIFASHYSRLKANLYKPKAGVLYLDFVNRVEKIGDHLININEEIAVKA